MYFHVPFFPFGNFVFLNVLNNFEKNDFQTNYYRKWYCNGVGVLRIEIVSFIHNVRQKKISFIFASFNCSALCFCFACLKRRLLFQLY